MGLKFRRKRSSSSKTKTENEKHFECLALTADAHSFPIRNIHTPSKQRVDSDVFVLSEPTDSVPRFRDFAAAVSDEDESEGVAKDWHDGGAAYASIESTCMSTDPILGNFSYDSFGQAKQRIETRLGDSGRYSVEHPEQESHHSSSNRLDDARDEAVAQEGTRDMDVEYDLSYVVHHERDGISDHDSGVVLGEITIVSRDSSNDRHQASRKGKGIFHIIQGVFGHRTSKLQQADCLYESDDSSTDDGSHPELKVVEFEHGSLENTSTISGSSGSDSDNSTAADEEEDDSNDDDSENLFGADTEDGWDEAILNCIACTR